MPSTAKGLVRLSESVWRAQAAQHSRRIRELLQPGLTGSDHVLNTGRKRQLALSEKKREPAAWTALNPQHPIYNFLIEYYGLKGVKGTRRLARWAPDPSLLLNNMSVPPDTTEPPPQGILLEGADFEVDLGDTLHLRGAMPHADGIVYNPAHYYGKGDDSQVEKAQKAAIPFLWYRSVLTQTLQAEPILHCHGLHEWAMQYQPEGAPEPPSAKYQAHLPLRVPRDLINRVVERKGVHCTHVDALRYFAPAAGPLNHHGSNLDRTDQLRLEQPACVHAHMDLIKVGLKLQPFLSCELLANVVEVALAARTLDVAASPYNATAYGVGVVAIETSEGRAQYRQEQKQLMKRAEVVRIQMLQAYDTFLQLAFDEETIGYAVKKPDPERYAKAEPGGLPWRKNLAPSST
eukprot:CAMPEP_0172446948 /NCGR_PEP_ID=MMETSP1065-20121228/6376_1 /TAXON_ID=265537 /ORGANISM="Amphiprora paludosa, Strain CCMP125" /LENGTH=403 /DNA_ID=CAMNT_0013198137 /DNA_START=41 /DNA_END=1252 /DNA_ORIENTATION=+